MCCFHISSVTIIRRFIKHPFEQLILMLWCSFSLLPIKHHFVSHGRQFEKSLNCVLHFLLFSAPAVDYTSFDDEERSLREMRPTGSNLAQLKDLMDRTRERRREWIRVESPDATTILKRYPRFLDVNELVSL